MKKSGMKNFRDYSEVMTNQSFVTLRLSLRWAKPVAVFDILKSWFLVNTKQRACLWHSHVLHPVCIFQFWSMLCYKKNFPDLKYVVLQGAGLFYTRIYKYWKCMKLFMNSWYSAQMEVVTPLLLCYFCEVIVYWDGRPRGRSSSPGSAKNFLFTISFRPALGSSQPAIQWVQGVKRQGHESNH
jgi:hypothetical protein